VYELTLQGFILPSDDGTRICLVAPSIRRWSEKDEIDSLALENAAKDLKKTMRQIKLLQRKAELLRRRLAPVSGQSLPRPDDPIRLGDES
jgi:hypothetical protein